MCGSSAAKSYGSSGSVKGPDGASWWSCRALLLPAGAAIALDSARTPALAASVRPSNPRLEMFDIAVLPCSLWLSTRVLPNTLRIETFDCMEDVTQRRILTGRVLDGLYTGSRVDAARADSAMRGEIGVSQQSSE